MGNMLGAACVVSSPSHGDTETGTMTVPTADEKTERREAQNTQWVVEAGSKSHTLKKSCASPTFHVTWGCGPSICHSLLFPRLHVPQMQTQCTVGGGGWERSLCGSKVNV